MTQEQIDEMLANGSLQNINLLEMAIIRRKSDKLLYMAKAIVTGCAVGHSYYLLFRSEYDAAKYVDEQPHFPNDYEIVPITIEIPE